MLIAATSGRSLAQAARASGYAPLVADAFADLDTQEAADAVERVGWHFSAERLLPALTRLASDHAPAGLVYGSGFEDRPTLLDTIAERWPIIGNGSAVVASVKDPFGFAELCRKLEIPHPPISTEQQPGWLQKQGGGTGGTHIKPAGSETGGGYFQQAVSGDAISALFLADGKNIRIVGLSRQWTSPTSDKPFRYGGALRPARLRSAERAHVDSAVGRIAAETGLKGLNSADFIVAPSGCWLIEINPRPGATLDIFRHPQLFAAHVEACQGRLLEEPMQFEGAAAAAVVYAERSIASFPDLAWPDWACDRQPPGTRLDAGDPLCTVRAEAETTVAARQLLRRREREIQRVVKGLTQ